MAVAKIVLQKSKTKSDGTCPVVLQVIHNRKIFRITLYHCLEKDWDGAGFKRTVTNFKIKNKVLRTKLDKAESVIDEIENSKKVFSKELFKRLFIGIDKQINVAGFLESLSDEFKSQGKISSSEIYTTLKNRLADFRKVEISFSEIDFVFLKKFETFLFEKGCTGGGVRHYMKYLRSTYNKAIEREVASENQYPFSTTRNKKGYSFKHLKSDAEPRALSLEDMLLMKTFDYEKNQKLKRSYFWFMFSYYARGMNFKDMALLKKTNIYGNRIRYKRSKTKIDFNIQLNDILQEYIDFFENPSPYVFGIINEDHKTQTQISDRLRKVRKTYNSDLKKIAKILSINVPLTSYVARHTYANTLRLKGVSIDKISELLGHDTVETTKHYLRKFADFELDKTDDLL
jgi:site-specific recombinase XerD